MKKLARYAAIKGEISNKEEILQTSEHTLVFLRDFRLLSRDNCRMALSKNLFQASLKTLVWGRVVGLSLVMNDFFYPYFEKFSLRS